MKNYSKLFFSTLIAAGTLFAGTQFADAATYTNYKASSGSLTFVDGDTITNRATTNSLYGSDSYELGVLIGLNQSKSSSEYYYPFTWDSTNRAWLESETNITTGDTVYSWYYRYEALLDLRGSAQLTTNGNIVFQGNSEVVYPSGNSYEGNGGIETIPIIILSGNSKWTNNGDSNFDIVEFYIVGNSTFENSATGTLDIMDYYHLHDNAKCINAGTMSSSWLELLDNSSFTNTGTVGSLRASLVGNSTFVNEASGEFSGNIDFFAEASGTTKFQNYGKANLYEIRFQIDADVKNGYDSAAKATAENYGTIFGGICEVGFRACYDANYYSGSKLTTADLKDKLMFVNRGTISGNLEVSSFVNLTLVQGSTITENLGQGSAIRGNLSFGSEVNIYFVEEGYTSFVAGAETLNIILTGTSSDALIAGDLILENSVNLSVTAEGTLQSKYSVQVWAGDLIVSDGDGFVATSGTFIVDNTSYKWILNTDTGYLTAASAGTSLEPETVTNLVLSSGTKTFADGDVITNREVGDPDYGSENYTIGILIGANAKDSSHYAEESVGWDSTTGMWWRKWVDADARAGDYEYRAYDALMRLSGSAQVTTTGTVTLLSNNYSYDDSDYENGIYRHYDTVGIVALTGNSKWTNQGTVVVTSSNGNWMEMYLSDNAVLENKGTISGNGTFEIHARGNSKIINSGTLIPSEQWGYNLFFDSSSLENTGTSKLGYAEFYDNSKVSNSGVLETLEICLYGNATIVNESAGTISSDENYSSLGFYSKLAGTAKFQNYGNVEISWADFCIDLETDDYNPNFKASIENYGTWKISSYGTEIGLEAWIEEDNTNYKLSNADFENRFSFTNRGIVQSEQSDSSIEFSSFVNLTLVGGSTIVGNVKIGDEVDVIVYGSEELEFRADAENLSVILSGTENPALIDGDLELGNYVNLSVSAEGTAQLRYTQVLWSGELTTGDFLENKGVLASDAFLTTSGTFVLAGTNYTWVLDVATGTITAKSIYAGEDYVAENSTDNFLATASNDTIDLSNLAEYAGTITGSAEVYSKNDLEFSGNLSGFNGKLLISSGTFTATDDAKLGSAAITISATGTLVLAGTQTVENKISGSGILELFADDFNLKQGLTDENLEVHVGVGAYVIGPQLVIEKGWVENSMLGDENTDTIRLGKIELSDAILTANKIYLTGTQISGIIDLNCHAELVNVVSTGVLVSHDFAVNAGTGTVKLNVIVDGDATGTTITHLADNSIPIVEAVSGTGIIVDIADCNIKLSSYARTVMMFSGEGDGDAEVGVAIYEADCTPADVDAEDIIKVATPRGVGEYYYKDDGNGNVVLYGMKELIAVLGYAAMPAMTIDVYNQDVKSLSRDVNQRLIASRFVRQQEFNFFAEGHGNALDKDGAYEYKTYGAMVGGDWQVAKNLVVGAALGYDYGDADIDGGNDKIEMDNYRLTAFAGTEFGRKIQISGGLTVGGSSFDIKRSGEKASVDSLNYGAFARISTDILLTAATRIVPYVGVSAMICDFDSFSDSGAKVSDETVTSVRGTIGVAANYQMFRDLVLTLDVSYTHEFCDDELDSSLDYGTGTQKISEEIGNADFATIGVGASYSLSPAARISLGYSLDIGDDLAHHANVGFSYSF